MGAGAKGWVAQRAVGGLQEGNRRGVGEALGTGGVQEWDWRGIQG